MPLNAVARDNVDYVLPVEQMGMLLGRLAGQQAGPSAPLPEESIVEDKIAERDFAVMESDIATPGDASRLACPDCGGVLNQIKSEDGIRFRCQVGHAFTPVGLAAAQSKELERALAIAVRTHRDRIKLFTQMCESARQRGLPHAEQRWRAASDDASHLIAALEKAMASLQKSEPHEDV
jgi:two-component system chemotaxis response regulator CheB